MVLPTISGGNRLSPHFGHCANVRFGTGSLTTFADAFVEVSSFFSSAADPPEVSSVMGSVSLLEAGASGCDSALAESDVASLAGRSFLVLLVLSVAFLLLLGLDMLFL